MAITGDDISGLYEQHATALLRFAMQRTLDAQLSVDIVGETFAVAFERRRRFRGTTYAEALSWLFGIAANLIKMYFRSGAIERRAMEKLGVDRTVVGDDELERIDARLAISEQVARARVSRGLKALRDSLGSASLEEVTQDV